jgi:CelD/BcsL family acetyltransferase involved in cellulose biosynthesis
VVYTFERLDIQNHDWPAKIDSEEAGTIYQTPAWLTFLSRTQNGEPIVAALREGSVTIGYFTGMIVRKFGVRIMGSPFPGWSTDYMGFALSPGACRRQAVQALLDFAFEELRCVHLEVMDRNLTLRDLDGLGVQYRVLRGFEIDLSSDEDELFSNMTSACRRCIRKAEKEGVRVEEAHDREFAEEYYAQLKDVFAKQNLVPTYDVDRVRQLIAHIHPTGHLLMLRARNRDGQSIATGIFPHLNGVLYFWGGASWRKYQLLRPNEAIQWEAIKIAKRNGLHTYDMGGGGEYKRKYGGCEIVVPWFRKSKYHWIRFLRDMAQQGYKLSRRCDGQFNRLVGGRFAGSGSFRSLV